MRVRLEPLERLPADSLGRAVGRDQLGMLGLERLQPLHQPVEFEVADDGVCEGAVSQEQGKVLIALLFLPRRFSRIRVALTLVA